MFPAQEKLERFVQPDCFQIDQELKHEGGEPCNCSGPSMPPSTRSGPSATAASASCSASGGRSRNAACAKQHRAGAKAFIDYCGRTPSLLVRDTSRRRSPRPRAMRQRSTTAIPSWRPPTPWSVRHWICALPPPPPSCRTRTSGSPVIPDTARAFSELGRRHRSLYRPGNQATTRGPSASRARLPHLPGAAQSRQTL